MTQTKHPMRDAPIVVYQRVRGDDGAPFFAWICPMRRHPVCFSGNTAEEAEEKARAFAEAAADKHEATYLARVAALEKARAKRAKKGE